MLIGNIDIAPLDVSWSRNSTFQAIAKVILDDPGRRPLQSDSVSLPKKKKKRKTGVKAKTKKPKKKRKGAREEEELNDEGEEEEEQEDEEPPQQLEDYDLDDEDLEIMGGFANEEEGVMPDEDDDPDAWANEYALDVPDEVHISDKHLDSTLTEAEVQRLGIDPCSFPEEIDMDTRAALTLQELEAQQQAQAEAEGGNIHLTTA